MYHWKMTRWLYLLPTTKFTFSFAFNVAWEIQNGLTIFTLPHNFKAHTVLWCPIKVRVFHQNESCLSCPHPPLSSTGLFFYSKKHFTCNYNFLFLCNEIYTFSAHQRRPCITGKWHVGYIFCPQRSFIFGFASNVAWEIQKRADDFYFATQFQRPHCTVVT